jgi:aarF domain-containing kinase
MLPAPIQEVLTRVQDSADYMPASQRDQVLVSNLGPNWRELFSEFSEVPMAAASIGQVHSARLASNGIPVAVKIQYPGVAASISSDLNNLSVLLNASKLLPKGLYLEKTIANARLELGWECDYVREAECAKRFAKILEAEKDVFSVPRIFEEACGPQVLTMEMMKGIAVTRAMPTLTQEERDFIGTQILGLCFREVARYRFMQTDPNWTNFLWNAAEKKIELLDFGASREFPEEFITLYTSVLRAAADNDREAIRDISIKLGYLTGLESEGMTNAHVESILTLGEPFSKTAPEVYDFSNQTVTDRVKAQIPLMLRERLAPPPEETYSLHRKLSGAFLMCARLGSRVRCREIFEEALGRED